MRMIRLLIPSLALAALLAGCRSAPLTVESLIHTDARAAASFIPESQAPLELFAADVFAREQIITPSPGDGVVRHPGLPPSVADPKPWSKEPSFSEMVTDDADDKSGTTRFLALRTSVPSSPRARAILDADRERLRARIPATAEMTELRLRAILTLRNERLTAYWVARGIPVADTERIAFEMLFAPDEDSRRVAFTLFRHYLIRSPEPMAPFIDGLKATLEAEAPFARHYQNDAPATTFPDASSEYTLEAARELLDADAARQHNADYLSGDRNQASLSPSFWKEPRRLALIAALKAFYQAQCESPAFQLTEEDLARVIHRMLTDPAWRVREAAFTVFQQDVLRGYSTQAIMPLVEKTARERILFSPDPFSFYRKSGEAK